MASKKKTGGATGAKKKRAPFIDRVTSKITKLQTWITKTVPRFASAPKSDVADSLGAMGDSAEAILDALPKLSDWSPPTRGAAFSEGDLVSFKKDRAAKLVKEGAYSADELSGEHEILAVVGRRVKLKIGLFQSLFVTKSA